MHTTQKNFTAKLLISILLILAIGGVYIFTSQKSSIQSPSPKSISIDLYIQDKEIARTSDCSVTQKITIQVPETSDIIDTSLSMLFADELSEYGTYDSVTIEDTIAKVLLTSDTTSTGRPIGSLSSCESGHLLSVLHDTLTQYETITSVELYSPNGPIEF